ncbi:MAG: hypothetical protein QOI55_2824 [Actinomycetota bacterium]|nr:hypothetical protein [Actinomycetota bacterium]
MRFFVDPWDPAYGASLETEMTTTSAPVTLDVERPVQEWAPISPPAATVVPDCVVFVDGVRRLEARTWIDDADGTSHAGIFASYAAGAVRCDGTARIADVVIGRGLYSPAPALTAVDTRHGTFGAHTTVDATPEALMYAVHEQMAEAEVTVAERTRRSCDDLLLLDGPLRKRGHIPDAVGLIKSHHVRYLEGETDGLVGRLEPGQRTPVFLVEAYPFSRYSWYLKLPGPLGSAWAGVVRCEATGALAPERVVALADVVAATIPRFASEPHKDARAPQNLYPIGGLERELRRRLGDPRLLYRALRIAAASAAA